MTTQLKCIEGWSIVVGGQAFGFRISLLSIMVHDLRQAPEVRLAGYA